MKPSGDLEQKLCGYLNVIRRTKCGRIITKPRWAVFKPKTCRLFLHKNPWTPESVTEIDISFATFTYDVKLQSAGQFSISAGTETYEFEAGTVEKRSYWLQELQRERRNYSMKCSYLVAHPEIRNNMFASTTRPIAGLLQGSPVAIPEGENPAKDLVRHVQRPADLGVKPNVSSRPSLSLSPNSSQKSETSSSGILRKPKTNLFQPRSLPSSPCQQTSPVKTRPKLDPLGFSTLHERFRRSFREKKCKEDCCPLGSSKKTSDCMRCEQLAAQVSSLQEDLQATEDEYHAAKEVISVLQKQLEAMSLDKEDLHHLQIGHGVDPTLLFLMETRSSQLVEQRHQNQVLSLQQEQYECNIADLHERLAAYQEALKAKAETIVRLTNEYHDLSSAISHSPSSSVPLQSQIIQTDPTEEEQLKDALIAYQSQNSFLNKEILELNYMRQDAAERERKLLMEGSEWEARFYQIQSKYLLLLNEFHNPQTAEDVNNREILSQLLEDVVGSKTFVKFAKGQTYDKYGFRQESAGSLQTAAVKLKKHSDELQTEISEQEDPSVDAKWDSVVSAIESREFHRVGEIKAALRSGIPHRHRCRVWKTIIDFRLRHERGRMKTGYYQKLLGSYRPGPHLTPAAKQIELDLVRTLPNNRHYENLHADGIPKLRRVLLAYSLHNPEVEYCQGFNRLVAIALLFVTEEDAFWFLVFIVEHLMPPEYFSKQLIGAQVDQRVLKDLISEKLPTLHYHLEEHSADISIFTLNWFLCMFVDGIPVDAYLRIWDTFFYEGSKVLFRYSLAIFKEFEKDILAAKDCMSIFNALRQISEKPVDMKKISNFAFQGLNPFPKRAITTKREYHRKILMAEHEELEQIRKDYFAKHIRQEQGYPSDEED